MNIIPLVGRYSRRKFTLVDPDDVEWIAQQRWPYLRRAVRSRGRLSRISTGYAKSTEGFLHRVIMARAGHNLAGKFIDHHNGWGLDNRKVNLRVGTSGMNARNTQRKPNIHKYKGEWSLVIGRARIGTYPTREEAYEVFERVAGDFGYVTAAARAALLQPVIDFLESQVTAGVLKRLIVDAPLIEDRYQLAEI